jgi:hypothetical protein
VAAVFGGITGAFPVSRRDGGAASLPLRRELSR